MAKVIAFCGIDGAGKSTQAKKVSEELLKNGYKVKILKINTPSLDMVFKISKKLYNDPNMYYPNIPPELVQFVVACDFASYYSNLNLDKNYDFLLCDRHKLCYFAYSKAYKVPYEHQVWIENICNLISNPDLTLYFDIDYKIAHQRLLHRESHPIKSDENQKLLVAVSNEFYNIKKSFNDVRTINAELTEEAILHNIFDILYEYKFLTKGETTSA